jgi:hypothetical protein
VRLRRVAQAIDAVLNDQELLRESVDRIVRDFIDNERKHIVLEDEMVFPAILDTLQPADWADIALTLADRYGPPSEADFEESSVRFAETYSNLRRPPQLRGGHRSWFARQTVMIGNLGCLAWHDTGVVTSKRFSERR